MRKFFLIIFLFIHQVAWAGFTTHVAVMKTPTGKTNQSAIEALCESHCVVFSSDASQDWLAVAGQFTGQNLIDLQALDNDTDIDVVPYSVSYNSVEDQSHWNWAENMGWVENPDDAGRVNWSKPHGQNGIGNNDIPIPGSYGVTNRIVEGASFSNTGSSLPYFYSIDSGVFPVDPLVTAIPELGNDSLVTPAQRAFIAVRPGNCGSPTITAEGCLPTGQGGKAEEIYAWQDSPSYTSSYVGPQVYNLWQYKNRVSSEDWNFWEIRSALRQTAVEYATLGYWQDNIGFGLIRIDNAKAVARESLELFAPAGVSIECGHTLQLVWRNWELSNFQATRFELFDAEPIAAGSGTPTEAGTGTLVYEGNDTSFCYTGNYSGKWLAWFSKADDDSYTTLQACDYIQLPAVDTNYRAACVDITQDDNWNINISWKDNPNISEVGVFCNEVFLEDTADDGSHTVQITNIPSNIGKVEVSIAGKISEGNYSDKETGSRLFVESPAQNIGISINGVTTGVQY